MNNMRKLMESLELIAETQEDEIVPITSITSPSGEIYKFNAIKYNIVPGDLMVKLWEPDSHVYDSFDIEYAVLKRIVSAIEEKL